MIGCDKQWALMLQEFFFVNDEVSAIEVEGDLCRYFDEAVKQLLFFVEDKD